MKSGLNRQHHRLAPGMCLQDEIESRSIGVNTGKNRLNVVKQSCRPHGRSCDGNRHLGLRPLLWVFHPNSGARFRPADRFSRHHRFMLDHGQPQRQHDADVCDYAPLNPYPRETPTVHQPRDNHGFVKL